MLRDGRAMLGPIEKSLFNSQAFSLRNAVAGVLGH